MHPDIVPAILATSRAEFVRKLRVVEHVAPLVQIDAMDGRFVPNRTWADSAAIARLRTLAMFEVHLMVREPWEEIVAWGRVPRVRRIIIHAESTRRLPKLLDAVRATGKEVGLAVNPGTPLARIRPYLRSIDTLLIMANAPGFSGQPFRRSALRRIAALRRAAPSLVIGVDIGVNRATAPLLHAAGATYGAAASAVFGERNPVRAYHALRRAFRTSHVLTS